MEAWKVKISGCGLSVYGRTQGGREDMRLALSNCASSDTAL
ncbi:hypothetical protein NDS46_13500 [Paenibacillus thiaminolyticus]|nr:hypothetical protein [Paenibacillus thiaminolyticus]WCF10791.1 hypothetical protein NDS46_13500 [Paenibacillus thiaminolyticus]